MAIKKKPIATPAVTVEDFIGAGGQPPADIRGGEVISNKIEKSLKLRLDEALLQEIDEVISSKRPSPSRHHWIVSAIVEKLDREKSKSGQNDI